MGWEDTKNPDTGAPLVGWKDPKTGRISNDPNEGFGAGSIPLWGSAPARGGSSSSSQPSTPAASAGGGGGGGGGGGSNRPTLSSGQLDDIRSEYHENTGRNITDAELQQYASRYTGNNFQSIIDSLEALDVAGTNPGGKPKSSNFFESVWEDTSGSVVNAVKNYTVPGILASQVIEEDSTLREFVKENPETAGLIAGAIVGAVTGGLGAGLAGSLVTEGLVTAGISSGTAAAIGSVVGTAVTGVAVGAAAEGNYTKAGAILGAQYGSQLFGPSFAGPIGNSIATAGASAVPAYLSAEAAMAGGLIGGAVTGGGIGAIAAGDYRTAGTLLGAQLGFGSGYGAAAKYAAIGNVGGEYLKRGSLDTLIPGLTGPGGSGSGSSSAPSGPWELSGDGPFTVEQITAAGKGAGLSDRYINNIIAKHRFGSAAELNASIRQNVLEMNGAVGGGGGFDFGDMSSWGQLMSGGTPNLDYAQMINQSYGQYQSMLADLRKQTSAVADENTYRLFNTSNGVATLSLLNALDTTGALNVATAQELNRAIASTYPTYYTDVVVPSVLAQRRSASLGEVYARDVVPSLLKNTQMLSELGYTEAYRRVADPRFAAAAEMSMSALPGTIDDRLMTQRITEQRALEQMYNGVKSSQMLDVMSPALMATALRERGNVAGLAEQQLGGARYLDVMDAEGTGMVARAITIEEQVSRAARDMLTGEIPADVADAVERTTAERMGARSPQVAANMLAKNLGLTSLDVMNQGQQYAQVAAGLRSQTPALGLQLWAGRQAPVTSYLNTVQTGAGLAGQLPALADALASARLAPTAQALSLANDAAAYGASVPAAMQQVLAPTAQQLLLAQGGLDFVGRTSDAFAAANAGIMRPTATGAETFRLMGNFMPQLTSPTGIYTNMLGLGAGATTVSPAAMLQVGANVSTNMADLAFRTAAQNQQMAYNQGALGLQTMLDVYGFNAQLQAAREASAASLQAAGLQAGAIQKAGQTNFWGNAIGAAVPFLFG